VPVVVVIAENQALVLNRAAPKARLEAFRACVTFLPPSELFMDLYGKREEESYSFGLKPRSRRMLHQFEYKNKFWKCHLTHEIRHTFA
jgi:hypothetical protein